jgi:hypothetical protein
MRFASQITLLLRARAVDSARLHSRRIDNIRRVRPLVPGDGGESGKRS